MALQVGQTISGRYRIVRPALVGPGEAYVAEQTELGREVLLKILLNRPAGDLVQSRFQREATLSRKLEHPNTVRLLDFGVSPEGFLFIAYEHVKGRSLAELIAGGPLEPERVRRIALAVLKSLMEAHGKGIVHRDVTPANVFLCDFAGESDFVKVMGFGIAKEISSVEPALTRDGQVVGTPAYMAPELFVSNAASPASDLYSLGLVLAEALTGKPVFVGSDVEICMQQALPNPVPLPLHALATDLGPLLQRVCQKNPSARPQSADELIVLLGQRSTPPPPVSAFRPSGAMPPPAVPLGLPGGPPGAPGAVASFDPGRVSAFAPYPNPTGPNLTGQGVPPGLPLSMSPPVAMPPYANHANPMTHGHFGPPIPQALHRFPSSPKSPKSPVLGCVIAAVGGFVMLVVAVIAVGIFLTKRDAPARAPALPPAAAAAPNREAELQALTPPQFATRVRNAGFTVLATNESSSTGLEQIVVTIRKGTKTGVVTLLKFESLGTATLVEETTLKNRSQSVKREGRVVLTCTLFGDEPAAEELLRKLVGQ